MASLWTTPLTTTLTIRLTTPGFFGWFLPGRCAALTTTLTTALTTGFTTGFTTPLSRGLERLGVCGNGVGRAVARAGHRPAPDRLSPGSTEAHDSRATPAPLGVVA